MGGDALVETNRIDYQFQFIKINLSISIYKVDGYWFAR